MPNNGVLVIGDQILGYTERWSFCYWDIDSDFVSERKCSITEPFYRYYSAREVTHKHILYTFNTRWAWNEYDPIPCTDRKFYVHYALHKYSERYAYFYPDTRERYCYYESLLTQTPLLLRYPKYYDWTYIPQVINPEFKVWSHYDLNEDEITLHIISDGNGVDSKKKNIFINSGVNKSKFTITQESDTRVFKIVVHVDQIFENGENIDCYFSLFDNKGNHLKPGLW